MQTLYVQYNAIFRHQLWNISMTFILHVESLPYSTLINWYSLLWSHELNYFMSYKWNCTGLFSAMTTFISLKSFLHVQPSSHLWYNNIPINACVPWFGISKSHSSSILIFRPVHTLLQSNGIILHSCHPCVRIVISI